ncbi:MAG: HAMP domain-containing histidine kinase [Ruminococcaceae bacterium]|nr:HAMP domain-containing histidine kinase [Oscillospiraceae bacterium]
MKSTFSRTLTAAAAILLAALIVIGVSFQVLVKNFLTESAVRSLKKDGEAIAQLVQAYYEGPPSSAWDFHIALSISAQVSESDVVVFDDHGRLLMCAENPLGCEHIGMTLNREYLQRTLENGGCTDTGTIPGLYEDVRYLVSVPVMGNAGSLGIIIISSPVNATVAVLDRISEIFLTVSLLVVAACAIVMTIFARRTSAPLRDMAKTASAFGHGELTARVPVSGKYTEEVEELALAFNNMASSLQKSEYQRQEFVANISHELKTPMTSISGYIDGILDGTIPPEKSRQYLQLVSDETKRLSRLVRSMLDISRLQDQRGIPEEQLLRFDLTERMGQVLISFEQKITARELDVQVDMPEHPVYVRACEDHITQVIYNLLDNAVKFCPAGGVLDLTVQEGGGKAYVSITNSGETIPPEELPLVFDRFHKIDKSRSLNRDSWGLGLYIVKTIIDSHGENISVTSREGRTTFTFTLPLVN